MVSLLHVLVSVGTAGVGVIGAASVEGEGPPALHHHTPWVSLHIKPLPTDLVIPVDPSTLATVVVPESIPHVKREDHDVPTPTTACNTFGCEFISILAHLDLRPS